MKVVKSLKKDYPAAPPTLKVLDQDYHYAAAKGLFMPLNTFKFIRATLGFVTSHFAPNIAYAKLQLEEEALSHKAIYDAVQDRCENS